MSDSLLETRPTPQRQPWFLPPRWLLSARADLAWLFASVLVAWALFASWYFGWLSFASILVIWVFAFHGPHFWATHSRTYLDPAQRESRRRLLRGSLVWFAVGPAFVGLGLLLEAATGRPELHQLFFFLAAVWAFHHVVKQHFGFLALYRARHGEFDRGELRMLRHWLIWSLWLPALGVIFGNEGYLIQVPGVHAWIDAGGPEAVQQVQQLRGWVVQAADLGFVALQVLLLVWLLRLRRAGRGLNLPALLLLACCVPLTYVVLYVCRDAQRPYSYAVLVPILTTYHNLQYHGLVWHYNRRRFAADAAQQHWGHRLNRNFVVYAACGLAFTALTIGFEHYGLEVLAGATAGALLLKAFFWGFAFHHYYVDSKIWKVSQDEDLQVVLGLRPKQPA